MRNHISSGSGSGGGPAADRAAWRLPRLRLPNMMAKAPARRGIHSPERRDSVSAVAGTSSMGPKACLAKRRLHIMILATHAWAEAFIVLWTLRVHVAVVGGQRSINLRAPVTTVREFAPSRSLCCVRGRSWYINWSIKAWTTAVTLLSSAVLHLSTLSFPLLSPMAASTRSLAPPAASLSFSTAAVTTHGLPFFVALLIKGVTRSRERLDVESKSTIAMSACLKSFARVTVRRTPWYAAQ
mmetsp:Transcript_3481/g.10783  ORF Transcript_3481/g.10783 Transcript_3481/m.10783 type:complete len:240 (-) Transcript_3481:366-1085(-)